VFGEVACSFRDQSPTEQAEAAFSERVDDEEDHITIPEIGDRLFLALESFWDEAVDIDN
jgi:hypothetical protein